MNQTTRETISEEEGRRVAAWCERQIGVRWVHQGRAPGKALDCVGLPKLAALHACSIVIEDELDYSETPSSSDLLAVVLRYCVQVEVRDARAGDLALFWIHRSLEPIHAGVARGDGTMIHARRSRTGGGAVVIDSHATGFWAKHLHSFWRLSRWPDKS